MNPITFHRARGLTLVELLVTLVVVGLVLGMTGPGLMRRDGHQPSEPRRSSERLRALAIRSGRIVVDSGRVFLPDGRALAAGLDPLTGEAVR